MPAVQERITSAANRLLKTIRKAVRRGRATEDGLAVCEGPKLAAEALASPLRVDRLLLAERSADAYPELFDAGVPARIVADKLFDEIASTEHSQGVIALVRLAPSSLVDVFSGDGPTVVLDRIADPGNAGAIARSAEAFGAAGLVFVESASPENPKTLRAAAGSLFRAPFTEARAEDVIAASLTARRPLIAASAHGGTPLAHTELSGAAFVIGSEAHGVSDVFLQASERVVIPTERVESLNAAAAAAVLLYEAARRRGSAA